MFFSPSFSCLFQPMTQGLRGLRMLVPWRKRGGIRMIMLCICFGREQWLLVFTNACFCTVFIYVCINTGDVASIFALPSIRPRLPHVLPTCTYCFRQLVIVWVMLHCWEMFSQATTYPLVSLCGLASVYLAVL